MREKEAILKRLRRRAGMSPEKREALATFNRTQVYRGHCRVCRTSVSGPLSELSRCPNCGWERDSEPRS